MNRFPCGWWIAPALVVSLLMWIGMIGVAVSETIDPTITPTKLLNCTMPIARTDGTALDINEIAEVQFYVGDDGQTWSLAGAAQTECKILIDFADVSDGEYFYTADVADLQARRSIKSPDILTMTVKRVASPAPPSALGWQ